MLDRLLESKARRKSSPVGIATSVSAHLAIIVIALHATAQSRQRPKPVLKLVVVPFVSKSTPNPESRSQLPHSRTTPLPRDRFVQVVIDPKLPPIDFIPTSPTLPTDFTDVRPVGSRAEEAVARAGESLDGTFNADQVERQVGLLPGSPVPSYPEALRTAGIEGRVVAQFIVDSRGLVESDSVRFLGSDNALFEASVRNVLRRMRFAPAEIAGRKVRQLVQMPFVFTISGR
jgi:periplasmic protein TonB